MGFLLSEPDQIPVLDTPVGSRGRDHIERLQNIRLSLRVVSVEYVRSLGKSKAQRLVIPEIRKFKRLYDHMSALLRCANGKRLTAEEDGITVPELSPSSGLRLSVD